MADHQRHVIIGDGLAGATAAETLRAEGAEGPITILGAESSLPYDRPPLIANLLQETQGPPASTHPAGFYDQHGIDLRIAEPAEIVDIYERTVTTSRSVLPYDQLLLATGSRPRRLDIPGFDLDGIEYLQTADDAQLITKAARSAERIIVIGGGWIASEVGANLRAAGHRVTLLTTVAAPLASVLGSEVASIYRDLHVGHGVDLRLGESVTAFHGRHGRVTGCETTRSGLLEADLIVVGIGADPCLEVALLAGLRIDGGGVAVNRYLMSSAADVFAAGDIAAAHHPQLEQRIRHPHRETAHSQGTVAAHNMLGHALPYLNIPYLFSEQYDLRMEYRGYAPTWDQVIVRGLKRSGRFTAFWLLEGRVLAALNANVWDECHALEHLVKNRCRVNPRGLSDVSVPLSDLLNHESRGIKRGGSDPATRPGRPLYFRPSTPNRKHRT